jgi:hypothetical protein
MDDYAIDSGLSSIGHELSDEQIFGSDSAALPLFSFPDFVELEDPHLDRQSFTIASPVSQLAPTLGDALSPRWPSWSPSPAPFQHQGIPTLPALRDCRSGQNSSSSSAAAPLSFSYTHARQRPAALADPAASSCVDPPSGSASKVVKRACICCRSAKASCDAQRYEATNLRYGTDMCAWPQAQWGLL